MLGAVDLVLSQRALSGRLRNNPLAGDVNEPNFVQAFDRSSASSDPLSYRLSSHAIADVPDARARILLKNP